MMPWSFLLILPTFTLLKIVLEFPGLILENMRVDAKPFDPATMSGARVV